MFDLGEIGQVETVLEDAVTKHPTCVSLWKRRLEMMIGNNTSKEVVLKTFKKARKRVPEKVKMKREFLGDLRSLGGHLLRKSMSFVSLSVCVYLCMCHSLRIYSAGGNICALRNVFILFFSVICSETRLIEH